MFIIFLYQLIHHAYDYHGRIEYMIMLSDYVLHMIFDPYMINQCI